MRVVLVSFGLSSGISRPRIGWLHPATIRGLGPVSHDGMARFRCKCGTSAMKHDRPILFPPFRLDPVNQRLNCDERVISLRPKTFGVLYHLAERANQLVTKDELLDVVWPGLNVGDAVLKGCVREIREALGDDPNAPRFIETAHRLGYRFIAPVIGADRSPSRVAVDELPTPVGRE